MINLAPLLGFLKIISLFGMIATVSIMGAVVYEELKKKNPKQIEKHKWTFLLFAGLMNIVVIFLYQKFIANR
jgi:uncharacterized membrane protein